jgi:hypothetical protein
MTAERNRFSFTTPNDLGEIGLSALQTRFEKLQDPARQRDFFDRFCDEYLNQARRLLRERSNLSAVESARQQMLLKWDRILDRKLDQVTKHNGQSVMDELDLMRDRY